MWKRRGVWTLAAVLTLSACSNGTGGSSPVEATDDEAAAAWMDEAAVIVNEDLCAGLETVELVDAPSGHSELMSSESFTPDPAACGQAPAAAGQALAAALPLSK